MRRNGASGQMVINMKTTITTSGAHSGYIVNSGIQGGGKQLHRQQYASEWSLPSQPTVETPGGSRQITNGSPSPYPRIQPSTSHESLNQSYSRVPESGSLWPPRRIPSYEELAPHTSLSNRPLDPSPAPRRYPSYEEIPRTELVPRPRSPLEVFKGRESPPDEFIQPSHITLNTFNQDGSRSRSPISYGLKKADDVFSSDALIHDAVMTTTTVEVFRTPLDGRDSALLSAPPGLDDRPQLLRLNGPPYEKWTSQKSETLINDRPLSTASVSRVQWKEQLVDEHERNFIRDLYPESRSPYEHAVIPRRSPSAEYIPTVHHVDPRLYQEDDGTPGITMNRSTSPYMVYSPTEMSQNYQQNPHRISPYPPQRTSSRPNSSQSYSASPSGSYTRVPNTESQRYQQQSPLVIDTPVMNPPVSTRQLSPVYVVPDRARESAHTPRKYEKITADGYSTIDREDDPRRSHRDRPHSRGSSHYKTPDGYSMIDRRRSQSHHRGSRRSNRDYERTRSMSPTTRIKSQGNGEGYKEERGHRPRESVDRHNNRDEHEPRTATTKEIFNLYQTRDAFDNVVAQFDELDFGLSDGIMLTSPLAESEESLISEVSNRNDRAKSDYLELRPAPPLNRDLIMEQVKQSRQLAERDKMYELPKGKTDKSTTERTSLPDSKDEYRNEHIYEELDALRPLQTNNGTNSQYAEIRSRPDFLENRPITKELREFVRTQVSEEVVNKTIVTQPSATSVTPAAAEVSRAELSNLTKEPQQSVVSSYVETDLSDNKGSNDSLNDWPAPPPCRPSSAPPPPPLITLPQVPPSLSRSSSGSSISSDSSPGSIAVPPPTLVQLPALPPSKPQIRKAHPDGLSFPKVASVPLLPDLPEETLSAKASSSGSTNTSLTIVPDEPCIDHAQITESEHSSADETIRLSDDSPPPWPNMDYASDNSSHTNNSRSSPIVIADEYKLKITNYQDFLGYPNESSV